MLLSSPSHVCIVIELRAWQGLPRQVKTGHVLRGPRDMAYLLVSQYLQEIRRATLSRTMQTITRDFQPLEVELKQLE